MALENCFGFYSSFLTAWRSFELVKGSGIKASIFSDCSRTSRQCSLSTVYGKTAPETYINDCFFKFSIAFSNDSEIELEWTYLPTEQLYHEDYVSEALSS
jgi:hypothetical protein